MFKIGVWPGLVVHGSNPSTWEAEAVMSVSPTTARATECDPGETNWESVDISKKQSWGGGLLGTGGNVRW